MRFTRPVVNPRKNTADTSGTLQRLTQVKTVDIACCGCSGLVQFLNQIPAVVDEQDCVGRLPCCASLK
ncbi:MAG: hypothetical protein QTN59_00230 [Candidatus Electrothrix communis]|nr:MAG: hypothetical protein QTN59_00230 [Candidatus Electrothrix communis]